MAIIIATIRFSERAKKTYDYLVEWPSANKIDKAKPTYLIAGSTPRGEVLNRIFVVNQRKEDLLPPHVITKLIIQPDNKVMAVTITEMEKKKLSTAKKPVKDKPKEKVEPADPKWGAAWKSFHGDGFFGTPKYKHL